MSVIICKFVHTISYQNLIREYLDSSSVQRACTCSPVATAVICEVRCTERQECCTASLGSAWQPPCGSLWVWHTNSWRIEETAGREEYSTDITTYGYDPVPETFEQVSAGKIAIAEQVLVLHSVSHAIDEKQSRQHSNDKHTGHISTSRGMWVEFSLFCVHQMEIVSSGC